MLQIILGIILMALITFIFWWLGESEREKLVETAAMIEQGCVWDKKKKVWMKNGKEYKGWFDEAWDNK